MDDAGFGDPRRKPPRRRPHHLSRFMVAVDGQPTATSRHSRWPPNALGFSLSRHGRRCTSWSHPRVLNGMTEVDDLAAPSSLRRVGQARGTEYPLIIVVTFGRFPSAFPGRSASNSAAPQGNWDRHIRAPTPPGDGCPGSAAMSARSWRVGADDEASRTATFRPQSMTEAVRLAWA